MPATFGAADLPDAVEAQTDCVVQSLSDKSSVETYSYRNEVGVTVKLVPGKMITREVTLETVGKGLATLQQLSRSARAGKSNNYTGLRFMPEGQITACKLLRCLMLRIVRC